VLGQYVLLGFISYSQGAFFVGEERRLERADEVT
jgi:hypothetical protein